MANTTPRTYADAGRMGIALGVLLFISFFVTGHGLGASGAFSALAGRALGAVAPGMVQAAPLADRIPMDAPLLNSWILLEIVGVFIGGAISARLAGRWSRAGTVSRGRIGRGLAGGALMGLGARLAYGCTSGLALSGGALLATGAWIFIPFAFGTAIALTLVARSRHAEVR